MSSRATPRARAASVPGLMRQYRSAWMQLELKSGEMETILAPL